MLTHPLEPLARYGALCLFELDRGTIVELLPALEAELADISDNMKADS